MQGSNRNKDSKRSAISEHRRPVLPRGYHPASEYDFVSAEIKRKAATGVDNTQREACEHRSQRSTGIYLKGAGAN